MIIMIVKKTKNIPKETPNIIKAVFSCFLV